MKLLRDDSALWTLLGAVLGVSLAGVLFFMPVSGLQDSLLKDYQSLVAGMLSLAAALLTVWVLALQIDDNRFIETQRRLERLRSARSMLPFALTELSKYARKAAQQITCLLPEEGQPEGDLLPTPPGWELPNLPFATIEIVRQTIEPASTDIAKALGDLLARVQIYDSRLRSFEERLKGSALPRPTVYVLDARDALTKVKDLIDLYVRVDKCFDYARFKSEVIEIEVTLDDMRNAAFNCNVEDSFDLIAGLIKSNATYKA